MLASKISVAERLPPVGLNVQTFAFEVQHSTRTQGR